MSIIVVADYEDIPTAVEAMKAGAVDFLVKPFIDESLLAAIRRCLARSRAALEREVKMRELRECFALLSLREQQGVALVAASLLNKEVGGELGISEVPVKAHRGHVVRQMKATSLAHLVKIGLKLRIAKRATESAALVEMPKAASRFA